MAIARMQKLAIFFPLSARDGLISLLHEKGAVQILDLKETPLAECLALAGAGGGVAVSEAEHAANDLKNAIDDLAEFAPKGGFLASLGGKLLVNRNEFARILKEFDYGSVLEEVDKLEIRRTELTAKRHHLEAFLNQVEPWGGLDVPFEDLRPTTEAGILPGVISGTTTPETLAEALAAVSATFHVEVVSRVDHRAQIIVFCHKSEEDAVAEVLRRNGFEAQSLAGLKGLPGHLVDDAGRQLQALERESEAILAAGAALAVNRPKLMIVYDGLMQRARKDHATALVGATEQAGVIQGWIKASDYGRLAEEVAEKVEAAEVVAIDPDQGEEPPVVLENRPIMKPFEVITELYGMPRALEVDPTPLAGPFFAIFFGFCLTDAGYGVVLALASLILMKYFPSNRKFFWLLFIGAIMTVILGALAGGWFSIKFEQFPPWMAGFRALAERIAIVDPFQQTLYMFGAAIALGFVQIIFGLGVKMVENARAGDVWAAIFDQLDWIVLLCSAAGYGLIKLGFVSAGLVPVVKWSAIVAAAAIVGFSNRTSKNPLARIGAGVYKLYGASAFMGDIVSYTRLLALALSTGGIGLVINQVAGMVRGIPVVGVPGMILVLVGGHTFNIAVNLLGSFVHSARLQYVEFYPKFFEGGGKPFLPFRKEFKYTRLVENPN